jgi:hypothetical protein
MDKELSDPTMGSRVIYWLIFGVYGLFKQHIFIKGWKDHSWSSFEDNIHNPYETTAFEVHQVCWLLNCILFYDSMPSIYYTTMCFNGFGLLICILGYSKYSEYTTCLLVSNTLQIGVTIVALSPHFAKVPIDNWLECLGLSLMLLLQIPALIINSIYTGDIQSQRKIVENMMNQETVVTFTSVANIEYIESDVR